MYPHQSEWLARLLARLFAKHALGLSQLSNPNDRRLAERYKKASVYLYSRIGRAHGLGPPELVNENDPFRTRQRKRPVLIH